MDHETLAKELIRALRGKRSQVALRRRLIQPQTNSTRFSHVTITVRLRFSLGSF